MCGIAGMFGKHSSKSKIQLMVTALSRRGPDCEGIWMSADGQLSLGHTRLSIIDLSVAGNQPMHSSDGLRTIVFNGEIYNYKEIRKELQSQGVCFKTHSDTEVILEGWKIWGAETPKRLRGMFAFAIFNREKNSLTLVRDRLGIKPLLWQKTIGGLVFASTLKAMFASGEVRRVLNEKGFYDYLIWGAVCQPRTMIRNVQALEPGTMIEFKVGDESRQLDISDGIVTRYWSLERDDILAQELKEMSYNEQVKLTRQKLEEACRCHLVADVPVGSFLSGGVDSTAITALMSRQTSSPVRSFSIGFPVETGMQNELTEARSAADFIGCDHTEKILTGKEVASHFDDFIDSIDQPSTDGLNTYWVSKVAHENGLKVALSGLGSDELFAGYGFFGYFLDSFLPGNPSWLDRLLAYTYSIHPHDKVNRNAFLKVASTNEKLSTIRRKMCNREMRNSISPKLIENYSNNHALNNIAALNIDDIDPIAMTTRYECQHYLLNTLLRDADALSMAHSLEVRPIFLDHLLAEFAISLPANSKWGDGVCKAIIKDAAEDLLPPNFFKRTKTGFTLPINYWMEHELSDRFIAALTTEKARMFFSDTFLKDMMRTKSSKKRMMWQLLVFLNWVEKENITTE